MRNSGLLLMILGMALVTYIPRALPAIMLDKLRFHGRVEKFLRLIPYTAMAALVFPGVVGVDPARPVIGLAGALAAGLLAWRKKPLMLCLLAAIAVDFLLYLFL